MFDEKDIEMLKAEAHAALEKWHATEQLLNEVADPALIDFAIYDLEAAKRRYTYLLGQIKAAQEQIKLESEKEEG